MGSFFAIATAVGAEYTDTVKKHESLSLHDLSMTLADKAIKFYD
jgi:hypothetical protein